MATKINSVIIVNQNGTQAYYVGSKHNGLLIDHINDYSLFYHGNFIPIYQGFTKDDDLVFEAINAPIDVRYVEDKEPGGKI